MESKTIKSCKEFKIFCDARYNETMQKNFKNISTINAILDSNFCEFDDLNKFLSEYQHYNGTNDPKSVLHKRFLSKIKLCIKFTISAKDDYEQIKKYWTDWVRNIFKIDLTLCQCVFRFIINFYNQNDFSLIAHFENNFSNRFVGNLKYVFFAKNLDGLKNHGWLGCSHDEANKEFAFSELTTLLLKCKKRSIISNAKIYINVKRCDERHIPTYVSSLINEQFWVICNGKIVLPNNIEYFGALPPAVFVTQENLSLLQQPLSGELWKKVKHQDFKDVNLGKYRELKPYLKICLKYLFEEFSDNMSQSYTKLRRIAYESKDFEKYVESIPFLALLIFAMYDNSYRSNLLSYAKSKSYYNATQLNETDFLLERQGEQDYSRYEIYSGVRDSVDVKNLLDHADELDRTKTKLHSTVISEIFECMSIAEGLLQILENAALHAGGGLFSMRIFSRATQLTTGKDKKEEHINYLNQEYSQEYFELDGVNGTSYFLEVQISDLSNMSIPQKFIKYYTSEGYYNAKDISEEEKTERGRVSKLIENNYSGINLKYFFEPSDEKGERQQKKIKKEFFNLSNRNFVFHYGLEIFRTLVTTRNGIFAVSGYNDCYQNFNKLYEKILIKKKVLVDEIHEKFPSSYDEIVGKLRQEAGKSRKNVINNITSNKSLSGTTYKILLPLNHNSTNGSSVVNSGVDITLDDMYIDKLKNIHIVDVSKMLEDLNVNNASSDIEEKRKRIEKIAANLKGGFGSKELLCLNFCSNNNIQYFEETIKGCVLFVLEMLKSISTDDIILPVALVNLLPFQLIEAARILAIFYSNNDVASKSDFNRFQFYLKSVEGKDLIFAGQNIDNVREKLLKTAMTNGAMNNDLVVINWILGGMQGDRQ